MTTPTPHRQRRIAALPAIAFALMVAIVAGHAQAASAAELKVPKRLKPGSQVVFKGTGFEPDTRLSLAMLKDGWGQDSTLVFEKAFPTDASGAVTMRFRLPRSWRACEGDHGRGHENRPKKCQRVRWKAGEKVDITAQSHVEPYSYARVFSRIARPGPKRKRARTRICTPGVPDAYDLRANGHVSCARAREVARRSFEKITLCIERGTCRAAGFRCRTRMARNAPPGLSGGFMICKRGKGRVRYGFGG